MKRFKRGLRSLKRFPELLRSYFFFQDGFRWSLVFLRLIDCEYPRALRLKNGLEFEVRSWQELTTVWVVCVGREYTIRECDQRIIDGGANVGVFSSIATKAAPEAVVVAVEPFPENYLRLEDTLAKNSISDRVRPLQAAIVGKERQVMMDGDPKIPGHSRRIGSSSGIEVEGITLAMLLERSGWGEVDLLKLDIEGAEYEVIEESPETVLRRFKRIGLEYHGKGKPEVLFEKLERSGFKMLRHPKKGRCGVVEWERIG